MQQPSCEHSASDLCNFVVCGGSCPVNSSELFQNCLKVTFFALVLYHWGSDQIYEMRHLFVAEGLIALSIVLPHWENMSYANQPSHIIMIPGQPVMFHGCQFMVINY